MKKHLCTVCDYIFDPVKGDHDGEIQRGTPFEEVSKEWGCPDCGAYKDDFEALAEA